MNRRAMLGMLAVVVPLLAAGAFPARASAPIAQGAGDGRIFVVLVNGTSLDDWLGADTFHLRRAIREGTPGLLSARTAARLPGNEAECLARPANALATLVNGARSTAKDLGPTSPLRDALRAGGATMRVIETPMIRDSSFPTGRRADLRALAAQIGSTNERVVVIDIPDTLLADCGAGRQRDRWVGVALGRADATIGVARSALRATDRLIVLSAVPPVTRERVRNYLTAATVEDPVRDDAAILSSATTRRRGVVSLTDVAGTITGLAGIDTTVGVGRAWRAEPGSAAMLQAADEDFTHAAAIRLPVMRGYVWLSGALIAFAAAIVLAGRGRARGGRIPRTGRDWIAFALAAIAAAPAAMLIEPLTGAGTLPASVAVIASAAIVIAFAAAVARGLPGAFAVCAGVSAWGLIAFVGQGELGARSALSYSVAGGDRFFGVGNEMMGVAIAATLVAVAQWLDGWDRAMRFAPPLLLVVAAAMAAPSAGAKFGSTFVAVPAFGYFLVRAAGHRMTRAAALGIAIATVLIAGGIAAWDLLSDPQSQSHVARTIADDGTLSRKIGAALRLAGGSYWTAGIAISAATALIFTRRRTVLLARGLWARPHLRAALGACLVAAIAAIAFNDAGIVASSLIGIIGASALTHALLVGQAPPAVAGERIRRLLDFVH